AAASGSGRGARFSAASGRKLLGGRELFGGRRCGGGQGLRLPPGELLEGDEERDVPVAEGEEHGERRREPVAGLDGGRRARAGDEKERALGDGQVGGRAVAP